MYLTSFFGLFAGSKSGSITKDLLKNSKASN